MAALFIRFSVKLILLMAVIFWLHAFTTEPLGLSVQDHILKVCYLFNTLIALTFFLLFLLISKNNPTILGWVFLLTSSLKFLIFFGLIYPSFQLIESSRTQDFLTFFIPYTAALTLEIYQLTKILNREN
jgi:hypothetical protein